jgi:hypothetical protein
MRPLVRPLASRMIACPQFKVLHAVVQFVAVLVMDSLVVVELAAEVLGHDDAMFKDAAFAVVVNTAVSS